MPRQITAQEAHRLAIQWREDAERLSGADMAGWKLHEAGRIARALDNLSEAAAFMGTAAMLRMQRPEPAPDGDSVALTTCPHGGAGHTCTECGRPICNLCGLWVRDKHTYCKDHKGDAHIQAR